MVAVSVKSFVFSVNIPKYNPVFPRVKRIFRIFLPQNALPVPLRQDAARILPGLDPFFSVFFVFPPDISLNSLIRILYYHAVRN